MKCVSIRLTVDYWCYFISDVYRNNPLFQQSLLPRRWREFQVQGLNLQLYCIKFWFLLCITGNIKRERYPNNRTCVLANHNNRFFLL